MFSACLLWKFTPSSYELHFKILALFPLKHHSKEQKWHEFSCIFGTIHSRWKRHHVNRVVSRMQHLWRLVISTSSGLENSRSKNRSDLEMVKLHFRLRGFLQKSIKSRGVAPTKTKSCTYFFTDSLKMTIYCKALAIHVFFSSKKTSFRIILVEATKCFL